ncbi:MAG: hypothetical protein SFZ24_06280 [Planctomycetota bacterium]|nr:hypothetical protein [Planctomycetota bacterium]
MNRGWARGVVRAVVAAAAVCGGMVMVEPARAQSSVGIGFYSAGGTFKPELSARDLKVFVRVFGLSDEERAALESLHAAYVTSLERRSREIRALVEATLERAEVMEDRRLLYADDVQGQIKVWERDAEALKQSFLADLRSLLTREQESRWPILERELRRLREIGHGRLAGESVDVARLVEDCAPESVERTEVAELLEQYAQGMDRLLLARESAVDKRREEFDAALEGDAQAAERMWKDAMAARLAIRALNERYVRQIGATLREEEAAKLDRAYFEAAHAKLCRPTRGEEFVRGAAKLESLSSAQRAEMDALLEAYERARLGVLRRIAEVDAREEEAFMPTRLRRALGASETEAPSGFNGDSRLPPDHPLHDLRRERLELDRTYRRKVEAVLREAQRDEVPQSREGHAVFSDWTPWGL